MTSEQYQNLRQLYFENLTGSIGEKAHAKLEEWLSRDENARLIWSELEEESRELNIESFVNEIEPELELEEIKAKIFRKTIIFPGKLAVAAMLAIAIGLSLYFVRGGREELVAHLENVDKEKAPNRGVSLTTPDGKAITLTKDGAQTMEVGGVTLDTQGGTLTYSGGNRETALNELYIPSKEDYEIVLADGTRVYLNSESKLKFPFHFAGNNREVYVEGEAFFEVKKDAARPFIVHTALADVVVTGTSFNVNTYDKKYVKTALVEGKVQIKLGDKKSMDLSPGFEATVNAEKTFSINQFDPDEVLSWRSGMYYFHNQPLGELSSFIARWYGIEVIFEKENLKIHPVSGLLEKGNLEEFLTDLNTTSGISYRFESNKLYLK